MNPSLKKKFLFVFGPSTFKLGLLVTLAVIILARSYYNQPATQSKNWLIERLSGLHQDSIDIRLRARGPRKPSADVAIVAVDDQAVEKLGRWPWPRGRIAEMVDRLVGYGTKVVGFDAIFSEPDNNQAVISLTRLKESGLAVNEFGELLDQELSKANTDHAFAVSVEKNSNHVVLGNYFDPPLNEGLWPYQELCGALVMDTTPESERIDNEEKPLAVADDADFVLPDLWTTALKDVLNLVAEDTKKKQVSENAESIDIKAAVQLAQINYCDNWLVANKDEFIDNYKAIWDQGRQTVEGWEELTFDQAVNRIRDTPLKNQVRPSGRLWMNLPIVTDGSKHNGYFNAFQDPDGTIRKSNLVTRYGSKYIPSLALKSIMVARHLNAIIKIEPDPIGVNKRITSFELINDETADVVQKIPVDSTGRLSINYAGPQRMFPHVSVYEIFNGKDTAEISIREGPEPVKKTVKKSEFFKDKIIIFGATALGIYDLRVTPFEENYPGVETHANVIDNMLRGDFLFSPEKEDFYMYGAIAALGITLSFLLSIISAVPGLLLTIASLAAVYAFDRYELFNTGYIVAIMFPIMLISALYISLTFYKYLTEERKKKAIKGTFEKYVSPAIVAEVLKDPSNLELGGKKQRMTVMFSDVRGFTTISEKLDPQALSAMLNVYLTPMTELVFKNKGTLDKYMGDAIMSFFGAPIHYADHAKMACQCALDMMELLPNLNKKFAEKGLPPIDVGIGLNTGDMSVGNMGSETVRSYTVMGDAVNLGSRLEGINKQYGTHIIISEFTYSEVKDDFVCREVDWVRVKGKLQPVKIFEVISRKNQVVKNPSMLSFFEKGTHEYHLQHWDEAIANFSQALNLDPEDAPSKLFLQRSATYKENPPPTDWDGVFEMKTK
jgi:adenylate cyclase